MGIERLYEWDEYKVMRQTFTPKMDGVPENLSRMHKGSFLVTQVIKSREWRNMQNVRERERGE
jgi:hypothetical protein